MDKKTADRMGKIWGLSYKLYNVLEDMRPAGGFHESEDHSGGCDNTRIYELQTEVATLKAKIKDMQEDWKSDNLKLIGEFSIKEIRMKDERKQVENTNTVLRRDNRELRDELHEKGKMITYLNENESLFKSCVNDGEREVLSYNLQTIKELKINNLTLDSKLCEANHLIERLEQNIDSCAGIEPPDCINCKTVKCAKDTNEQLKSENQRLKSANDRFTRAIMNGEARNVELERKNAGQARTIREREEEVIGLEFYVKQLKKDNVVNHKGTPVSDGGDIAT